MNAPAALPSFATLVRVFFRIGCLSFGGPAAQIALMHRILVDEKRWIGEARFLHALNYCMLLPGPEAQQLATYMGWLMHGVKGGLAAGLLFILPGAVVMLGLSLAYALFAGVPALEAAFFGIKCAVLAIVAQALIRVARRALTTRLQSLVALAAFLALFVFALPFPLVILGAALIGLAAARWAPHHIAPATHAPANDKAAPGLIDAAIDAGTLTHLAPQTGRTLRTALLWATLWLAPVAGFVLLLPGSVFASIAVFFSTMAAVTFGGAYAVLSYVAQEAVSHYGWLSPREMIHGLALAETTPGPLILVLQFTGFLAAFRAATGLDPLLAGLIGAALTLWVTFVPSFLWIFTGAPYAERLRTHTLLTSALACVTAAAVGVIAQLALFFALHVLFASIRPGPLGLSLPVPESLSLAAAALTCLGLVLVFRFQLGIAPLLAVMCAAGLALKFSGLA